MAGLGEGEPVLCAVCNRDPSLLAANKINSKRAVMSFSLCSNHSKEDIDKVMKDVAMELDSKYSAKTN
jgi:hypothetical protein